MRRIVLISLLVVAIAGLLAVPAQAFNILGHTPNLAQPGRFYDAGTTTATLVPTTPVPTTPVPTTPVPTTPVATTPVPTTPVPTMTITGTMATATPGGATATGTGPTATGTLSTMTPTPTVPPNGFTYVVQPGDTLNLIALRFGTTVCALAIANNIFNINQVYVGEVLLIVNPALYPCPFPYPYPTLYPYPYPTIYPYVAPPIAPTISLGGEVANLNTNTLTAMQTARMTWVKYQVNMGDINAFTLLAQAKAAGFKVLFTVVGDKTKVLDAAFQDTYATYTSALAKAGADAIEVWSEENIDSEWPTGQISSVSYVTLLRKAYVVIKAVNSNTMVITGAPFPTADESTLGLTSAENDDRYYSELATYGATSYADCIGIHYLQGAVSPNQTFGDPRDNNPTRYFDTMLTRVQTIFPNKPLCFTALGYLSPEGYGPLPTPLAWAASISAAQQAQWLGQAVTRARTNGHVALLIIFNVDFATYDSQAQAGYAILRPQNTCPACATIAAATY